jgi:hypothetical protein
VNTWKSRLAHAWNAFLNLNQDERWRAYGSGVTYGSRPDRTRLSFSNERSIIASILTRVSIDASAVSIRHVRLDDSDRFLEEMDSGLNNCLKTEANLDQGATHFRQDAIMTLLDQGCIAIVPVDTSVDPSVSTSYDIQTMRIGEIVAWMPEHVRVMLYNQQTGRREQLTLGKKYVAIVENPLYAIMNEPNSTLQRLIRKLNLLDTVDDQIYSGKLDLIIQLPYAIKTETKRTMAEQRRKDIEFQLRSGPYGIAYMDGTEKITQLNRPIENNLLKQVEYLFASLYGQLGLTVDVMNGTAAENVMLNYQLRTIKPIVKAITEAMIRTFLTKTARTQGQSIMAFYNRFDLTSVKDLAEAFDVLSRNEIASPNELRQELGWKPSKDPNADKLVNSNMPQKPALGARSGPPIQASVGKPLPALTARPDSVGDRNSNNR